MNPPVQAPLTRRFTFLCDFVGFGPREWKEVQASAAVLAPVLPALMDAVYDHLLRFEETRTFFLGKDGAHDASYLAIRKEHLTDWVLRLVGGAWEGLPEWLYGVGRRHSAAGGDPARNVPAHQLLGLTAFVQTALHCNLMARLPERPAEAAAMAIAWNKLLMLQLEIFLQATVPDWR